MQDKLPGFLQIGTIILDGHYYLNKEVRDEDHSMHVDKRQIFLQLDSIFDLRS